MSRIFISYRREDSEDVTGRIFDRLEDHFGRDNVFMDIDAIPYGVDFRKHIRQAVGNCDILLAVIGKRWLEARHEAGPRQNQRRLDDPADFVRLEIQAGLEREIPVIPVLVGGARMMEERELPDGLKDLVHKNAAEVRSGRDFRNHLDRLIRCIDRLLTTRPDVSDKQSPSCQEVDGENKLGELILVRREGETMLSSAFLESLERTNGKPTKDDKARVNDIRSRYRIPSDRARDLVLEVKEQWRKTHPTRFWRKAGDIVTNSLGMKFAYIPPGTFVMGSPESERDRGLDEFSHSVTLTKGFYLAVTPLRQSDWKKVMGNNPSKRKGGNLPVESVSWDDCRDFLVELSHRDGHWYRFPTEAEWEYACRAGTKTPYFFGETISKELANFDGHASCPVRSFPPNAWGLYDMHGNVWEWCADWYGEYPRSAEIDPTGPEEGEVRVLRGGSIANGPSGVRSASRAGAAPTNRVSDLGFRPARSMDD